MLDTELIKAVSSVADLLTEYGRPDLAEELVQSNIEATVNLHRLSAMIERVAAQKSGQVVQYDLFDPAPTMAA